MVGEIRQSNLEAFSSCGNVLSEVKNVLVDGGYTREIEGLIIIANEDFSLRKITMLW